MDAAMYEKNKKNIWKIIKGVLMTILCQYYWQENTKNVMKDKEII